MTTIVPTLHPNALPDLGKGITIQCNGSVLIHQQETIDGAICYRKGDVWEIDGNHFTQTTGIGLTGVQGHELVFLDLAELRTLISRGRAKFIGRIIGNLPNHDGDRYIAGGILAYAMGTSDLSFAQLEQATGYSETLLRAIQFDTFRLDDHIATEILRDILENANTGLEKLPFDPDTAPVVDEVSDSQRLEALETSFPCTRAFCDGDCEWELDIDQPQRVHAIRLDMAEGRVMEYLIDGEPKLVHQVAVELTNSEVVGSEEIWDAIRDLNRIDAVMGRLEIAETGK